MLLHEFPPRKGSLLNPWSEPRHPEHKNEIHDHEERGDDIKKDHGNRHEPPGYPKSDPDRDDRFLPCRRDIIGQHESPENQDPFGGENEEADQKEENRNERRDEKAKVHGTFRGLLPAG